MGRVAEAFARSGQSSLLRPVDAGFAEPDLPPQSNSRIARLHIPLSNEGDNEPAEPISDASEPVPVESLEGVDPCVKMLLDRGSFIAEQYRAVRTRLLSHNPLGEPWILGITSSIPREGKSVTTINLGFSISELRHLKVVLVDADLRHSSLARMLSIAGSPGLAETIRGEADYRDVIRPMYQSNFAVVPAGSLQTDNPAQLLASRRTGEMLRFLRSEYHYVLVDTPPANSFADVGIIGQICTGVLMVVRMNRTREPAAKRAIRLLQSNNINVLGCVLTAIRETGRQQYSYY